MTIDAFKKLKLPDGPGVYFFIRQAHDKSSGKEILYIGKATDLKIRVKSYFAKDLMETRGPKIVQMLGDATSVDYKQTDSVLEALILEAALIKKHMPPANTQEKDGKSFNYVIITEEDFPRILTVRGKELLESDDYKVKATFGPFPHGLELREALKIVRKIFPYRDDKCVPLQGKPCFNRQIGLCPGVCTGEISKTEYAKVIRSITLFFQGKKQEIIKGLRKHMKDEAKLRNFEKAAELRNKIFALEHINDIALLRREQANKPGRFRIEAFDIAHISGTHTVGSMVVMEDGVLAKHEYKRFKMKGRTKDENNDTANLEEMLRRRFKHDDWRTPDLIVIDGGVAQKNRADQVVRPLRSNIAIVSVVKNDKHKPDHIIGDAQIVKDYHHDILLVNQEAHRFAIAYHRLLRGKIRP